MTQPTSEQVLAALAGGSAIRTASEDVVDARA